MSRPFSTLLALAALLCVPCGIVLADDDADEEKAKPSKWAHLKLSGSFPEGPELPGIFGAVGVSLGEAIERMDKAATDEDIDGLLLEIGSPSIGWAKLNELTTAIAGVRKAGKPVYAYADSFDTKGYLLAASCDKAFLPESGTLMMVGLRAEVTFYKNLFDKVGIEPNMLRVGEFKSAAEPYTRTEMSPQFREEMQAVIDGYWDIIVQTVVKGRGLNKETVERLIDEGPHTAAAAVRAGLFDGLLYEDELVERIEEDHGGDVTLVKGYGKKEIDTDFSGFAGLAKMMNLMMGIDDSPQASKNPKIAVVYATGAIMSGSSGSSLLGGQVMGSDTIIKAIRKAGSDDKVKAVVLRVDSPGGSALASDLMWRALEKLDKPFVVSMGDTAASGGYYISMGADTIFAEPGTLTGSIGVVGGKLATGKLFEKLGVTTSVISRGKNSGVLSVTNGFTASERKAMQEMMNDIYRQFVGKAAEGRKMEFDTLEKLARGRVYTGKQALEIGLVDKLGTLDDAVAHARKLAGLTEQDKVDRLQLPKPSSPFEQLFGPLEVGARTPVQEAVGEALRGELARFSPELTRHLEAIEAVNTLSRQEPRLLVVPFRLDVK